MARVTPNEVLQIMDVDLTDEQVAPYITGANVFTDTHLKNKLVDSVLKEVERWMAAHMIAMTRERTAQSEEAGGAKIVYAGQWGKNLDATSFGQMAKSLDNTGTLEALNKGKRPARIAAIKE